MNEGESEGYATAQEVQDGGDTDDRILDGKDENLAPLESDFSIDTDTAFDNIISRLTDMLDPENAKMEMKVNGFRGCVLYEYE